MELSRRKVTLALTRLEEDDAVAVKGDQVIARLDDPAQAVAAIAFHEKRRKQVEASRLEMMRAYAETLPATSASRVWDRMPSAELREASFRQRRW